MRVGSLSVKYHSRRAVCDERLLCNGIVRVPLVDISARRPKRPKLNTVGRDVVAAGCIPARRGPNATQRVVATGAIVMQRLKIKIWGDRIRASTLRTITRHAHAHICLGCRPTEGDVTRNPRVSRRITTFNIEPAAPSSNPCGQRELCD